jgi:hypothetical protein
MFLITPDPTDTSITEDNTRLCMSDDPDLLFAYLKQIAHTSNNDVFLVWQCTQKLKVKGNYEIVTRYLVNNKGEVLPA